MLGELLIKFAIIAFAAYTAIAKPTLPLAITGKYRIQNAETGLFMDAEHAQQVAGTRVIVFTLDRPFAPNQEWNVDVFDGQFATIQSTKSFVRDDPSPMGGLVPILDPNIAAEFELFSVSGGVQICINSTGVSCLASPTNPTNQIRFEPLSNAANLTWIFEIIS